MRHLPSAPFKLFCVTLASLAFDGCRCSPPTAVPVKLVVQNDTNAPLFVDDSSERLGLTVKRDVQGTSFGFNDKPCECSTCEKICTCECADAGSFVRAIPAGQSAERSWDGIVRNSGNSSCGKPCLQNENAPLDETFQLELCYATQLPGVSFADAGRAELPGKLDNVTCVTQPFQVSDGTVKIGPRRGTACTSTSQCVLIGSLCLDGNCTSSCPANDFPDTTPVAVVFRNRGFFDLTTAGTQKIYTGTGTITSVAFLNRLVLQLSKAGAGAEMLTAEVNVNLPGNSGPPLAVGTNVTVKLVDDTSDQPGNVGVVVVDSATKNLLFAADTGFNKRTLQDADLAGLQVQTVGEAAGCRLGGCGKRLYFSTRFSGNGFDSKVLPGQSELVTAGAKTYRFVNANNAVAEASARQCKVKEERAFALWQE